MLLRACSILSLSLFSDPPLPEAPLATRPLPPRAYNHGPGTTGGGSSTASGETLPRGRFSLALRGDWTHYKDTSVSEAEAAAIANGEFDALGRSWVTQVVLGYGLSDDLELGLQLGYYAGSDFIDAEADGLGGAESATADPHGPTDTWVSVKWRAMRGPRGHLAWIAGLKLPTGKDDEELSNGEELEPSSQPGSGSVDYQAGVAFSRYLTPRVTLDASGVYTIRTAYDGFEVGDRADLGLALAYRLSEDVRAANSWSLFGELNGIWLDEDVESGVHNEDSGGTVMYLALGLRDRFSEHAALSVAPSVPILQDVNGDQVEADWRLALALTLTP
jgi:hypothetical protein